MNQEELDNIIQYQNIQDVINAEEFYFQRGQDALKEWLELDVSLELKGTLIRFSTDYSQFLEISEINPEIDKIKDLLLEIVSYCDNRAKDKNRYNKYEDKRVLADAMVRMGNWVEGLIKLKFKHAEIKGPSIINAFNYLLSPRENVTILSRNHRQMIAENLIKKPFVPNQFVHDLKDYFEPKNLSVRNEDNYTYLISCIIYAIKDKWEEDVLGLMASDSTGWQEGELGLDRNWRGLVLWNSKKPTGGAKILGLLRDRIQEGGSFPFYYSVRGSVVYRANVIDFAINQKELDNLQVDTNLIKHFEPKFEDYTDDNKSAKIVFIAESIEKISPISISDFDFYKCSAPRQDNLSPIKSIPEDRVTVVPVIKKEKKEMKAKQPLNQILYGPPGTGKTYSTIDEVVKICQPDEYDPLDHYSNKITYESLVTEGRVFFTTFHQSMSYEDFIEGIKPIPPKRDNDTIQYKVIDGIFKSICEQCLDEIKEFVNQKYAQPTNALTFAQKYAEFVRQIQAGLVRVTTRNGIEAKITTVSASGNMRLTTGEDTRDYIVSAKRLKKLVDEIPQPDNIRNVQEEIRSVIGGSNATLYYAALVAFKQFEVRYEETIREAGKQLELDEIELSQEEIDQLPRYAIVIDEINRGNVSAIFGELITLIEEDKRYGKANQLFVKLPYSKSNFIVPPNLYIIGTMNTADRSVEALDTALRRRFSFTEMPPRYDLPELNYQFAGSTGAIILETINKRISKLLDRDHLIGHSYFLLDEDEEPEVKLMDSFYRNIIPLLQEYFYGDYAKIGAVLGQGFIYTEEEGEEAVFGAGYEDVDYNEKEEYLIRDYREQAPIRTSINGVETVLTFETAIKLLLNT